MNNTNPNDTHVNSSDIHMDDLSLNTKRSISPTCLKLNINTSKIKRLRRGNNNDKIIATIFTEIPCNYNEAINSPNAKQWKEAIKEELDNLYNNNIITFVNTVPKGKNIITTKWVFSIKKEREGNISRFKARLVARGFKQRRGIDYELTYSPTLNIDSLKFIIALASKVHWDLFQLDIKADYLNAPLDTDIYTSIPIGDSNFGGGFWKMNKALYGLKQSGRQWNKTIDSFLRKNNFKPLKSEPCIYLFRENKTTKCIIGLYDNDMVIAGEKAIISNIIMKIKKI